MSPGLSERLFTTEDAINRASQHQAGQPWLTFEEILQRLHQSGIYIHSEQLAEFFLAHGLPVHLRYVPARLRPRAIKVNENYQGDMVRLIEDRKHDWDYSWMENVQMPQLGNDQSQSWREREKLGQPSWDESALSP